MTRHEAREQAFLIIFEREFQQDAQISELIEFASEYGLYKENDFSKKLVEDTAANLEQIDSVIIENLKGWSFKRISKVSKAILRMSVCEILFYEDIPAGASINEAVELAKVYACDDEPSFINGVLGSVAKAI